MILKGILITQNYLIPDIVPLKHQLGGIIKQLHCLRIYKLIEIDNVAFC